jgi:hypothetical protein
VSLGYTLVPCWLFTNIRIFLLSIYGETAPGNCTIADGTLHVIGRTDRKLGLGHKAEVIDLLPSLCSTGAGALDAHGKKRFAAHMGGIACACFVR